MSDQRPNNKIAIATALVALVFSLIGLVRWGKENSSLASDVEESAYERVLRTGTVRAGYVAYPPATTVNATGEPTGIFPDILREIGKRTELKIEFVEEVGWATLIEGLETRRYDVIGGLWANPIRGKFATVSQPVYYSGIGVWVRTEETRFNEGDNWASINRPDVRIAAIDGSTPLTIAKAQFSAAALTTYPNLTSESQLFLDLVNNRIDAFFAEPAQGMLFLAANPGTIKNIAEERPLRVFANVFLMRKGEFQLKGILDTALDDLQNSGFVEDVIRSYEAVPGAFYRISTPFVRLEKAPR